MHYSTLTVITALVETILHDIHFIFNMVSAAEDLEEDHFGEYSFHEDQLM